MESTVPRRTRWGLFQSSLSNLKAEACTTESDSMDRSSRCGVKLMFNRLSKQVVGQ